MYAQKAMNVIAAAQVVANANRTLVRIGLDHAFHMITPFAIKTPSAGARNTTRSESSKGFRVITLPR